ncbi:MAG: hypothetical protein PHF19_02435 [Synergistales bacterium]|nr:hypothetical protein [Synergistales bacterium]
MADYLAKLVYVGGAPFWRLPEGSFRKAEIRNGRLVEPGLRLKGTAKRLH